MKKRIKETGSTFEMARAMALSLPDVVEGTAYGLPAFRTKGKMFLVFREDLASVVALAPFETRDELMAADPGVYHTTDHHRPYPWVLAWIAKIHPDALHGLIQMAYQKSATLKRRSAKKK